MMPILRKELRSLLRERRGFLVPVLYAAVQAALAWLYFSGRFGHGLGRVFLGKTLTGTMAVLQLIAVVVFAPLVGASMIASERERGTWARHRSEVLGRIAGAFNPVHGLQLFFGFGNAHRLDWFAHYGAMLSLGGGALAITLVRVRRATIS